MLFCAYSVERSECGSLLFVSAFGFLTFINTPADFCFICYLQCFSLKSSNCKYVEGKELVDGL